MNFKKDFPLLIDALYVNNSGGLVLLKYLVESALRLKPNVFFIIDERCAEEFLHVAEEKKYILKPGIRGRNLFYKEYGKFFSGVFCFGNNPPPFRLKVPVFTYIHNPLLLSVPIGYPLKLKISKFLKTSFIRYHLKNSDGLFVQTEFMSGLLKKEWGYSSDKTYLFPFFDIRKFELLHNVSKSQNDYLFINNGNPHKNHENLLKAWKLVNEVNTNWTLHLTITEKYPELLKLIETYQAEGLNVENHGFVDPISIYKRCQYLVYPSWTESFGLGLIEGAAAGLQIIASDLPYTYNVVVPSAVFDPSDPHDMAKTILENRTENPDFKNTRLNTKDLISELLNMWP